MRQKLLAVDQPYPYYNTIDKIPKNAILIFLFVFLFLYLFSPFHVNETEQKYSYLIICIIHAVNAAALYGLFFLVFNKLVPSSVKEENWKVYHTILVTSLVLILIGFGSFLLRPLIYTNPDNFSWHYFIAETVNTFLAGTLVFAGFTLIDYHRLLKINQGYAAGFEEQLKNNHSPTEETNVVEEYPPVNIVIENEAYKLNPEEFLFAKAEGNYATFYFNKNNSIVKELKRASIKSIEEQINGHFPLFIKTHRAFLINTKHIINVTGNAQGYQLFFEHIDFPVPVSRALIPTFKLAMKEK